MFYSCWYINKVYRLTLKHGNLPMTHIGPGKRWGYGVTNSVLDTSNMFQPILVKGNILVYFSFYEKSPIKRVCPFNALPSCIQPIVLIAEKMNVLDSFSTCVR